MDPSKYAQFFDEFVTTMWRELDPFEDEIEDTEEIPLDRVFPILREMRAFGLLVPEQYGGVGLTISQYLPILAELSKIQGGLRVLVHVHNSVAHAFSALADGEKCAAILPQVAVGEKSIAFGLTEPEHGTGDDVGTAAEVDGDDYLISGRKWLITNSDFASHFMVICKVAGKPSAILVERERDGFEIEDLPELMGCKGGAHGQLTFDNVRVPRTNIIGAEGEGLAHMNETLEISRVFIAATSLGTAERSLELSTAFAKERVTFGKPIAARQAVQRYLAEMATDIHALRLLIDDAGERWDRGERIPAVASICKLFGLEAVGRVTDRALLVHGGIGYTRKHRIERLYRDARLNWLEEGTPTIQQLVIAREVLTDAFKPNRAPSADGGSLVLAEGKAPLPVAVPA